jgi:hypothetical protein
MITVEQIMENKAEFIELLKLIPDCPVTELVEYLEEIDYFNMPASTKHLKAYRGGLCEHALAVYRDLTSLSKLFYGDIYTPGTLAKVALLKDIYKGVLYEPFIRNVKNEETGTWEKVIDFRYDETREVFGDLAFSSYMIAKRFVNFSDEEIEAICMYQLASDNGVRNPDTYQVMRSWPLVTLLHMAEISAGYLR